MDIVTVIIGKLELSTNLNVLKISVFKVLSTGITICIAIIILYKYNNHI